MAGDGITRLMVEGGTTIWGAFEDERLLDEAVVFVNWTEHSASDGGRSTFEGPLLNPLFTGYCDRLSMKQVDQGTIGADRFVRFQRSDSV